MVVVDDLLAVVEGVVVPVAAPGVAVPAAHVLLVVEPEVAVLGAPLLPEGRVVDVVHAHRVPHLDAALAAEAVAARHEVGQKFIHVRRAEEHRPVGWLGRFLILAEGDGLAAEKKTPVGPDGAVLPVRRADLCRVERALEVHVVEDGLHAGDGVVVDVAPEGADEFVAPVRFERFREPEVPGVGIDEYARHVASATC